MGSWMTSKYILYQFREIVLLDNKGERKPFNPWFFILSLLNSHSSSGFRFFLLDVFAFGHYKISVNWFRFLQILLKTVISAKLS
jgi:hypothetical protein